MSWPGEQSPKPKNSPDGSHRPGHYGNFRSPYPSPRNGQDCGGQSPMKNNFGWRNNGGYHRFQNDRFHYSSPGANRRGGGGHFRGRGGHFRGSPVSGADISMYVNPSMLNDPWKELEATLGIKIPSKSEQREPSVTSTPSSSISVSLNTSVSEDDSKENVTEESVVISDDSSGDVSLSNETMSGEGERSEKTNVPLDSSCT